MESRKIKIIECNGNYIAEVISNSLELSSVQDALDIMADCIYRGARKIILHEKNIIPAFFNLKTRLAGEILQKFSTYKMQLAIVGDYSKYSSKSFNDFLYESNNYQQINFLETTKKAIEKLSK